MKIFNYDEDGYFTDVTNAHPNPEEKGKFLVPARASTMSPPTHARSTHRAKYLGNNQWQLIERKIIEINGNMVELAENADLGAVAFMLLKETDHEVLEAWEENQPVSETLLTYRRSLRKVIKGTRVKLPKRLYMPQWPSFAKVK
jgi:hypothetical protein